VALQIDGKIVAGGEFTSIGGATRVGFARLNTNGTADAGFAGPLFLDTTEESLACAVMADGSILSGRGVRVAANTRFNFAKFGTNGVVDQSFVAPILGNCFSLLIQDDGRIIVGGDFRNVSGTGRNYLLRLNPGGSIDTTFNPGVSGTNASVFSMAWQPDGKFLIAGQNLSSVGGVSRTMIARLNANGTLDTSFNTSFTGNSPQLRCIAVQPDGKIIVCGAFETVGGLQRRNMARLNPNGSPDAQFASPFTTGGSIASCAVLTDGHIAAGGAFETAGGIARNDFVMLNANGSVDTTFGASVSGSIAGLTVQTDGRIIFAGPFSFQSGSTERNGMARIAGFPVTQTLEATSPSRVRWRRGGGSPEVLRVRLELSTDGGNQWSDLGEGTRIAGGWERTGLTLPATGRLRARASMGHGLGNGSVGRLESVAAFTLAPEIAIRDGASDTAPEIIDGQTQTLGFGTTRLGTPLARSLTLFNPGNADLNVTAIATPAGFSVTGLPVLPVAVAPGQSLPFQVILPATAPGAFTGEVTIASDDADESTFNFTVSGLVVTPEILVRDGTTAAAPELTDGQAAPVDFGIARQASPVIRGFTIANAGTAPLVLSALTAPAGFTILNPPALPATIETGESLALSVRLDAAATGVFPGSISLTSDDFDEAVFDFPVTGMVVTPEIAVHEGQLSGPELVDGQAAGVDFGRNVQGSPGTRGFTIVNTGTVELKVNGVAMPPAYTPLNLPGFPLIVGINQSMTFQMSLATTAVGTYAGNIIIASDDLDEPEFDFPVTGSVFIPDPGSSAVTATTKLNRQTGLQEQTIHLVNDTTATVPAYNLIIRGLPAGVEVNNASETRADGSVVVYIRQGMQAHSTQDIVIEYYSADRSAVEINPQLSTEVVLNPPDLTAPAGETGLVIEKVTRLGGGEVLLEFTSEPGKRYQLQYSADGQSWQNSLPAIRAAGNRTQWIDRGLPRTDSPPSQAATRLYRVRELAP
jgi:uncharacterized delta-60 repeat protein